MALRSYVFLILTLSAACAERTPQPGSLLSERDTSGDTVTVRTLSGSAWDSMSLVEEIAIGTLEGEDTEMFGFIQEIAPDHHGGAYVFDGQAPALRHYDASGKYVRTLGRAGSGPGEYRDMALGLAVRRDGRVVMRDPRNARLNVYSPDGTPHEHWPVASGLYTWNALVLDTADHMYLKIALGWPEENKPLRIGLLHLDDNGVLIDTIVEPHIEGEPRTNGWTFAPQKLWSFSPLGDMVVALSSRYMLEVRKRGGTVLRIVKTHAPVEVLPDERAEHEAVNQWLRENQGQFINSEIPPVPRTKPVFHDIRTGRDGRIWVQLHTRAEKVEAPAKAPDPVRPPQRTWLEPAEYDVFEADGTYLGKIRLPPRTALAAFRGDTVWGIRRGEMDEQYVVRFRIRNRPRP